jgi:oligopeptide/dipeptide ABC transporter ATP-binding protein
MNKNNDKILLSVKDLNTWFPVKKGILRRTIGHLKAVNGISFDVERGKTFGLVGESGCGKTTAARTVAALINKTSGRIEFKGQALSGLAGRGLKQLRKEMSMVFQDPYGSLNPRMNVVRLITEPMKVHRIGDKLSRRKKAAELLAMVGLSTDYMGRYPHEFSGGQRQRIVVARALALDPELVICDEPVSALDVSIQSQVLNLLKELQQKLKLTYIFIAHDLAVVKFICDEVAVMYLGRIVERASSEELYASPLHPYTRTLMAAIPRIDTSARGRKTLLAGEVPSIMNPPSGCPFNPRCSESRGDKRCLTEMPPLQDAGDGHFVACWHPAVHQKP